MVKFIITLYKHSIESYSVITEPKGKHQKFALSPLHSQNLLLQITSRGTLKR